jgi:WD40 repeat protein
VRGWLGGAQDRELRAELSGHKGSVTCLTIMGTHVWSGSADHTIIMWNVSTRTQLLSLPDQGGYIRCFARLGWALWTFSSTHIRVWASQSLVDAADSEKLALQMAHTTKVCAHGAALPL